MKDLIIVESPTKAKTINRFLGKKFNVIASRGHIRDLPKSKLGVDVTKNYKPDYEIPEKAKKNVEALRAAYKKSENIYLATDEDREGEAISWHIAYLLNNSKGLKKKDLKRITFHEITEHAIQKALRTPGKVNTHLVNAQQARRVLDRLVGYKLSPLLWKKIQFGLSAGRVQSVALRLIVDREHERIAFKEEDYFTIQGIFDYRNDKINAELESIDNKKVIKRVSKKQLEQGKQHSFLIKTEEHAKEVLKDLKQKLYFINSVNEKEKLRRPFPPYTTSLLQQAGSNLAGFSASRTMRSAQKLYENGLITYHRTDSYNLSNKFIDDAQKFITKEFGNDFYKETHFKTKSKGAQEAHEAIRPTHLKNLPENIKLPRDEKIIYELIYARSLASLMTPIKSLVTRIDINSKDKKYLFKSVGSRVLFEGWAKAYKFVKTIGYNPLSEDNILPKVEANTDTKLLDSNFTKSTTQPPARYTEASLIKALEKYGIGRPSTYAPIISTITSRNYVEKENKYLIPLDLGMVVIKLLEENFADIMDYDFTAKVEGDLDKIAEGKENWVEVVDSFYKPFEKKVIEADAELKRKDYKVLGDAPKNIKCPECKAKMVLKLGRQGKFYSCSKFPDCKGARFLNGETEEDFNKKVDTKDFKKMYKTSPKTDDGRDFLLRKGRFGEFWAHPDYPKVKEAKPLQYTKVALVQKFGKPPKTDDGRDFLLRSGKFGTFWAHPDYPKVKETRKITKT